MIHMKWFGDLFVSMSLFGSLFSMVKTLTTPLSPPGSTIKVVVGGGDRGQRQPKGRWQEEGLEQ